MKNLLFALFCALLCFSLVACSGKENKAGADTDISSDSIKDSEIVTEPLPDRVVTSIYGMLDEQYDFIYEDICMIPETFTSSAPIYSMVDEHNSSYDFENTESLITRTPAIYYLASKLNVSADDLKAYYSACFEMGITDIMPSDEVIGAIAGGDASAAMKACAHPSALCKDGKIYTLRMLLSGSVAGVSDDEIKATVERAKQYYGVSLFKSEQLTDDMKDKLSSLGFEVVKENAGSLCSLHSDEYHTIPAELENLVDAAELKAWKEQSVPEGDCTIGYNIVSFVSNFAISKDDLVEIYNAAGGTLGHYNINVIYGDAEAASVYYSEKHAGVKADIEADRAMALLKEKVANDLGMTDFVTNVHEFSLAELLLMTNRNDEYLATLSEYMDSLIALPEFDLVTIYDKADDILRLIRGHSAYYVDRNTSGRRSFETPFEAHGIIE